MKGLIKASLLSMTVFAGAVFSLSSFHAAAQEKSAVAPGDGQFVQAKATFKKTCSRCHGEDGRGDTVLAQYVIPPDFTDAKWWKDVTDERLIQSITDGKVE